MPFHPENGKRNHTHTRSHSQILGSAHSGSTKGDRTRSLLLSPIRQVKKHCMQAHTLCNHRRCRQLVFGGLLGDQGLRLPLLAQLVDFLQFSTVPTVQTPTKERDQAEGICLDELDG